MPSSLNFALGDTVDALRDAIRTFALREVAPRAAAIDQANEFPHDLWAHLGAIGALGITVAEEYGGADLGYLAHVVAMEEITRASAAVGLSYGAHSNLCVNQIQRHGTPEQKIRYLPPLVRGERIGALAMSEPEAGSDVVSMKLRAERQGDHYLLTGRKMWITNGPDAETLVVYAKCSDRTGSDAITAFIVERSYPGFSTSAKLDKLGMRGSNTCELVFDRCPVPVSNMLGGADAGVGILMSGLDYERVILAGGPLGIMQACLDAVLPYVRERQQFGRPLGKFQLIRAALADMYIALSASRAYVYAAARACDRGEITRQDAAAVILFASERATAVAGTAIRCLGGNGYTNDYPVGRLWRDAKLYEIGAGTNEIRRLLIGRELFNTAV